MLKCLAFKKVLCLYFVTRFLKMGAKVVKMVGWLNGWVIFLCASPINV